MVRVEVLVDSPRIVKHGEQAHDIDIRTRVFGQAEAVLQHSGPMSNAVVAAPREGVILEDSVEDQADILCHDVPLGDTARRMRMRIETRPVLGMSEPQRPEWCPWS